MREKMQNTKEYKGRKQQLIFLCIWLFDENRSKKCKRRKKKEKKRKKEANYQKSMLQ